MTLNKLKPYATAGAIILAGILGANTAKAEPIKKVIPAPIEYKQPEEKPTQGVGLELLLTGGEMAASILTNKTLHDKYDDLTLADQTNMAGYRKKLPKLKTDYEYNDLTAVKSGLEWLTIAGELTASLFVATAIHEYGHAATANIHGVGATVQILPSTIEDGTFLFGYTTWDWEEYSKKSEFQRAQMAAGGMIATRTFAEKLDKIMDATNLPPRLEQAMAALYFMNRFDATRYILSCALKTWTNTPLTESNDPQSILNSITGRKYKKRNIGTIRPANEDKIAYAIATGAILLDTLLDWKEIHTNLRRLFMMETDAKKEDYNFNLSMTPAGVYANFTYEI